MHLGERLKWVLDALALLASNRRSLDIPSLRKEAKLSASKVSTVIETIFLFSLWVQVPHFPFFLFPLLLRLSMFLLLSEASSSLKSIRWLKSVISPSRPGEKRILFFFGVNILYWWWQQHWIYFTTTAKITVGARSCGHAVPLGRTHWASFSEYIQLDKLNSRSQRFWECKVRVKKIFGEVICWRFDEGILGL